MNFIRHYLLFTTRNFHHPLASVFYDSPGSLFSKRVAPRVPDVTRHKTWFDTSETPPRSTTPLSRYSSVTVVARKAAVTPLVAEQLFLSRIPNIPCNRVEIYTYGSNSTDALTAVFYMSKHSFVHGFKLSHCTLSNSAELSVVYYALEHLRQHQPTHRVFLIDPRSASLPLRTSDQKESST